MPQDRILREGCKVGQHDLLNHRSLLRGMIKLDAKLPLSPYPRIQASRRELEIQSEQHAKESQVIYLQALAKPLSTLAYIHLTLYHQSLQRS